MESTPSCRPQYGTDYMVAGLSFLLGEVDCRFLMGKRLEPETFWRIDLLLIFSWRTVLRSSIISVKSVEHTTTICIP